MQIGEAFNIKQSSILNTTNDKVQLDKFTTALEDLLIDKNKKQKYFKNVKRLSQMIEFQEVRGQKEFKYWT